MPTNTFGKPSPALTALTDIVAAHPAGGHAHVLAIGEGADLSAASQLAWEVYNGGCAPVIITDESMPPTRSGVGAFASLRSDNPRSEARLRAYLDKLEARLAAGGES